MGGVTGRAAAACALAALALLAAAPASGIPPQRNGSIDANDPVRVQDIESTDSPTACGQQRMPSQRYPGTEHYDTMAYRNFGSTSSCVTVNMTGPITTHFVWASAYLDSFDTADGFSNVIGWEGAPAGYMAPFQQFSFDVPAGHTFVLVVEEAAAPGAGVPSYSVLVQGDNIAALDGGVIAANDARRTQTTTNGASTCASSGTPGVSLAAPRYDVFTYQNPYPFTPPVCYTATVDVASGGGVWATAYGPSFSPANALSNYLGGAGHIITAGNPGVFSFRAPTYQDFQIVVNEADEDFGSAAYTVQVHDSAQVPTAAVLRSFSAERDASGVALRWRTAAEEGFLGFNVYLLRGSSSSRLNRALIPAVFGGTRRGHAYRLHDPRGRGGARYRLEGVELDGSRGRLGDAVAG